MDKRINIEAERAAFEAAMPAEHPRDRNMPDKSYNSPFLHCAWQGWLAARRATPPATGAMEDLPPLPEPHQAAGEDAGCWFPDFFDAGQMKQYAREAIAHYLRKQAGQESEQPTKGEN